MMHLFQIVPASGRAHQMIPAHALGQTGDKPPNYKKKCCSSAAGDALGMGLSVVARKRRGLRFLVMSPSDFSLLPLLSHLAEWRWKSPASLKTEPS